MDRKRTSGVSHNKNANIYKYSNRLISSNDNNTQSIKFFFTSPQPEEEKNDEDQQVILYGRSFFNKILAIINEFAKRVCKNILKNVI